MEKIILETIDSTNEYAKRISKEGNDNLLIIANNQTNGRGTHGRAWFSEDNKNILMSFLIRNINDYSILNGITIKIGQIIYEVLSQNYDLNFEVKLPNDILCNGKKICGILCESSMTNDKINYLIIGIGLDVNQTIFDGEIENIATSLKKELGYDVNKEELIDIIKEKIENLFDV